METRHRHGTIDHDHEGGAEPHNHKPGDPLFAGPPGNPYRGEAMLGTGILIAVIGGAVLAWQSNNHSACNSALVQATSPQACQLAQFIWTLGGIGLLVGITMIIAGTIRRS